MSYSNQTELVLRTHYYRLFFHVSPYHPDPDLGKQYYESIRSIAGAYRMKCLVKRAVSHNLQIRKALITLFVASLAFLSLASRPFCPRTSAAILELIYQLSVKLRMGSATRFMPPLTTFGGTLFLGSWLGALLGATFFTTILASSRAEHTNKVFLTTVSTAKFQLTNIFDEILPSMKS